MHSMLCCMRHKLSVVFWSPWGFEAEVVKVARTAGLHTCRSLLPLLFCEVRRVHYADRKNRLQGIQVVRNSIALDTDVLLPARSRKTHAQNQQNPQPSSDMRSVSCREAIA